jgi:hypothetical protein
LLERRPSTKGLTDILFTLMPESGVSVYGVYSMAYILFLAIGGIGVKGYPSAPWRKGGIG